MVRSMSLSGRNNDYARIDGGSTGVPIADNAVRLAGQSVHPFAFQALRLARIAFALEGRIDA